jgi:hypothetical protein
MFETISLLVMFFVGGVAGFSLSQAMVEDRRRQEIADGKVRRLFKSD